MFDGASLQAEDSDMGYTRGSGCRYPHFANEFAIEVFFIQIQIQWFGSGRRAGGTQFI